MLVAVVIVLGILIVPCLFGVVNGVAAIVDASVKEKPVDRRLVALGLVAFSLILALVLAIGAVSSWAEVVGWHWPIVVKSVEGGEHGR